jgi:hypothetical protein
MLRHLGGGGGRGVRCTQLVYRMQIPVPVLSGLPVNIFVLKSKQKIVPVRYILDLLTGGIWIGGNLIW